MDRTSCLPNRFTTLCRQTTIDMTRTSNLFARAAEEVYQPSYGFLWTLAVPPLEHLGATAYRTYPDGAKSKC